MSRRRPANERPIKYCDGCERVLSEWDEQVIVTRIYFSKHGIARVSSQDVFHRRCYDRLFPQPQSLLDMNGVPDPKGE